MTRKWNIYWTTCSIRRNWKTCIFAVRISFKRQKFIINIMNHTSNKCLITHNIKINSTVHAYRHSGTAGQASLSKSCDKKQSLTSLTAAALEMAFKKLTPWFKIAIKNHLLICLWPHLWKSHVLAIFLSSDESFSEDQKNKLMHYFLAIFWKWHCWYSRCVLELE